MEILKQIEPTELRECQFCSPEMTSFTHFEERGLERIDLAILRKTENFVAKPDSLPVHPEGIHMLVIPNKHTYSFAQLPTEVGPEVQDLVGDLETTLGEELVLFEHGGIKHGGKIQSVYHAHAHLIGSGGNNVLGYMAGVLEQEQIGYDVVSADHNPVRNIQGAFQNQGYFYIQQDGFAIVAHDPNEVLPSQLAQRNMSALLTGEVVNWKKMGANPRYADLSVGRISSLLDKVGAYEMPVLQG